MIKEGFVLQTFQISKEDLKFLTKLANAHDVSRSSIIRKAIKSYINSIGSKKKDFVPINSEKIIATN